MKLEKKRHPQFPNSTIIEAIIEIHFDNPLTNNDLNRLIEKATKNYKTKKEDIVIYSAAIGSQGMSISQEKSGQFRIQIQKSESILVQIFSDRLSVHWLGKYLGWKLLESEFLEIWDDLKRVFSKVQPKKFGVRFINRLDEKSDEQPLKVWLKQSPNYPKNLLESKSDFFYRGKWRLNQYQIMITIAESDQINENIRPLLYDIDIIYANSKIIKNRKEIAELISSVHEAIWSIFISSISTQYKKLLQRKKEG